jgi:hypothetical protein
MKKIIVCWYGSFNNNGTIGDLLAVETLTNYLSNFYIFDHLTYSNNFKNIKGTNVYQNCDYNSYDIFIFCCGPIIKNHGNFNNLINKFNHCYKIGISVSLFDKNHFNYLNPFDYVISREGNEIMYEDLAILSTNKIVSSIPRTNKQFTIGLVLRGDQYEYGKNNCLTTEVNYLVKEIQKNYSNIVFIDNHLHTSNMSPDEILNEYLKCDFIITTRFHGCIIAIGNNIPFIGIDQILNGAKLQNLISKNDYEYIFNIRELNIEIINKKIKEILNNKILYNEKLLHIKNKKINNATHSLSLLNYKLE